MMREALNRWLKKQNVDLSADTAHSLCNSLGLDGERVDECLGLCYQLEKGEITEADFTGGLSILTGKKPEEVAEILKNMKASPKVPDQLVLDVGAGPDVDSRATHAVDLQAPMWLSKAPPPPGVDYYPDPVNLGPQRYFLFGRVINPYDRLPYNSDMFDLVVSHAALGVEFKEEHAYKEVFRVLKPGGKVEIKIPDEFKEDVDPALIQLRQVGFESVAIYRDGTTRIEGIKR